MTTIVKLNKWANAHTNIGIDILRVALGAFLFYKGVSFMEQTEYIVTLLDPVQENWAKVFLAHYIAPVHLVGGLFIAMGLLTRLAVVFQLPILVGAVLVNFISFMEPLNLLQSSLAFLFCMFFLFYGSGKHSVDYTMKLNM